MAVSQDYCDWCYGELDSDGRRLSKELGLDEYSTWACRACISVGRVENPPDWWDESQYWPVELIRAGGIPDWWDGHPNDWPTARIQILERVALGRANVEIVRGDIMRTTSQNPDIEVDSYMDGVRIAFNGGYTTPSVFADANPQALAETADYLQAQLTDDMGAVWPLCFVHEVGVHAEVHDGVAVWWCRVGDHLRAPVGELGAT
jgi:hypothetical protein